MTATRQSLGPYQVIAPIGSGGMGEVVRARDTRLNREVAIKVLPKEFAADPDRLRRFEQESKTLAALNHPNILTIHDAGVHEGAPYLVSELLEGKTLREEMNPDRSGLPLRKATDYALQIAQGLAAAHSKGIIHRDLKPENIFVTKEGRVKILDFGLAKLQSNLKSQISDLKSPSDEAAPTLLQTTELGMVLGTPAYMSPEQVRGEPADHRSDIFACGCVLYEMLSGARAFRRDTPIASMNAVLREEPDLSGIESPIPTALERIMRRCLEKQTDRRFQSASDLAFALENAGGLTATTPAGTRLEPGSTPNRWRQVLPWALGASLGLALLVSVIRPTRSNLGAASPGLDASSENKFQIYLPGTEKIFGKTAVQAAISPDGRKLAYVNEDGLWLYRLDRIGPAARLVSGQDICAPFWSPDSLDIGYFDESKLNRIAIDGARPMLICYHARSRPPNGEGAAWLKGGRIIFTTGDGPLLEASASGAREPSVVLTLGPSERAFEEPSALPGGRGVLLNVRQTDGASIAVWTPDGKRKALFHINGGLQSPVFSPSSHILYWQPGASHQGIWAFPFSLERLEKTGEPFLVSEAGMVPSASNTGALAFSLNQSAFYGRRQLTWVDRSGRMLGTLGEPLKGLSMQQIAPDGRQVVAISREPSNRSRIWLFDAVNGGMLPFSPPGTPEDFFLTAQWSADGHKIVFTHKRKGEGLLFAARSSDGSGEEQFLFNLAADVIPGMSRSGHYVFATPLKGGTNSHSQGFIEVSDPDKKFKPFPEAFQGLNPRFRLSPDDRLLAFVIEEGEHSEVYVVEFPSFKNRQQVSRGGGWHPEWHPNGQELFFLAQNRGAMMSRHLKPGTSEFEAPEKVFDLPDSIYNSEAASVYDVAPDVRFLMMTKVEESAVGLGKANIQIVLNWFEEFRVKNK